MTSYGSLSVGDSIPFILSGIGYHVYSWSWRLRVNRKIKDKMVKFTSTNAVENFTAVALNVFTLYYICQELYTSQVSRKIHPTRQNNCIYTVKDAYVICVNIYTVGDETCAIRIVHTNHSADKALFYWHYF